MEAVRWTDVLSATGMAIGLSACAGLRAWLPLLFTGLLVRGGFLQVGPAFGFISSNRALLVFGLATLVELAADKIPALDHALDALSTLLRPAAASLLAASLFGDFTDPLTATLLGVLVGTPTSLVPHAAKSTLRAASTAFTGGLANPILSLLEDVAAVLFFLVTVVLPLLAAALVVLLAVLVARRLRRRPLSASTARAT
jgi:uncharacterized protein DUF4126